MVGDDGGHHNSDGDHPQALRALLEATAQYLSNFHLCLSLISFNVVGVPKFSSLPESPLVKYSEKITHALRPEEFPPKYCQGFLGVSAPMIHFLSLYCSQLLDPLVAPP